MKTFCVAVVVLSLISVCSAASLACEQLLKPLERSPDLTGRWHYIAFSTENCLVGTLFQALFSPSVAVDFSPKDGSIVKTNYKVKIYGHCLNETESYFIKNNMLFDVDESNAPTGEPDAMLLTGCQDCIVVKESGSDVSDMFALLSRRTSVSAEELQEFEAQVKCSGLSKPHIFNTDHDYVNCKIMNDDVTDAEAANVAEKVFPMMWSGVERMCSEIVDCISKLFWSLF